MTNVQEVEAGVIEGNTRIVNPRNVNLGQRAIELLSERIGEQLEIGKFGRVLIEVVVKDGIIETVRANTENTIK